MSKAVIVGGSSGLGLAITHELAKKYTNVIVLDLKETAFDNSNLSFKKCDISKNITEIIKELSGCDCLIITAGFGVVKPFIEYSDAEIVKNISVNSTSIIRILHAFYDTLLSSKNAKCLVVGSIAGEVSSPLFSVYGAAKASISKICESLNIELEKSNSSNRITCVIATSFQGTSFNGGKTDLSLLDELSKQCISAMDNRAEKLFINEELCLDIIKRYQSNPHEFGLSSYDYKIKNNRISNRKSIVIGYLSGTFDLFHIGHLNLLRRAKEQCDYLIVGVHKSGAWKGKETFIPFEERIQIVGSIKYVDEVCESFPEDSDAWNKFHYDKLFVGSDYKGSERFKKYEEYFADKDVEIVYFSYTQGISSSQLREKLK